MRLPYIAVGIALPPIAFSLYARHLFALYPPGPIRGTDTVASVVPHCSLDRYVDHFYGTWMLRLEGVGARLSGYPHVPGQDYAHGLFRVVSRSGDSLTVRWNMPQSALRLASWLDVILPLEGEQIFTVVKLDDGQTRLQYTCNEEFAGGEKPGRAEWWHRLYMRILLDQTRRNILRDSR